jgi:Xaa-Pro aminopeptidase
VLTVEAEETEYGKFLAFETVTLFPMDVHLVDESLMSKKEIKWFNQYQKRVYKSLKPHLNKAEKAWLKEKCAKI